MGTARHSTTLSFSSPSPQLHLRFSVVLPARDLSICQPITPDHTSAVKK